MTYFLWICVIYVVTILLTYPLIKKYAFKHEKNIEPYNPLFFARVMALMPGLNIIVVIIYSAEVFDRFRRNLILNRFRKKKGGKLNEIFDKVLNDPNMDEEGKQAAQTLKDFFSGKEKID